MPLSGNVPENSDFSLNKSRSPPTDTRRGRRPGPPVPRPRPDTRPTRDILLNTDAQPKFINIHDYLSFHFHITIRIFKCTHNSPDDHINKYIGVQSCARSCHCNSLTVIFRVRGPVAPLGSCPPGTKGDRGGKRCADILCFFF